MESLLDEDTKLALEHIARPLRVKIENIQNKLSDTLIMLEKLQIKLAGMNNENYNDHK